MFLNGISHYLEANFEILLLCYFFARAFRLCYFLRFFSTVGCGEHYLAEFRLKSTFFLGELSLACPYLLSSLSLLLCFVRSTPPWLAFPHPCTQWSPGFKWALIGYDSGSAFITMQQGCQQQRQHPTTTITMTTTTTTTTITTSFKGFWFYATGRHSKSAWIILQQIKKSHHS